MAREKKLRTRLLWKCIQIHGRAVFFFFWYVVRVERELHSSFFSLALHYTIILPCRPQWQLFTSPWQKIVLGRQYETCTSTVLDFSIAAPLLVLSHTWSCSAEQVQIPWTDSWSVALTRPGFWIGVSLNSISGVRTQLVLPDTETNLTIAAGLVQFCVGSNVLQGS
jgi:hypothetical protein